MTNEIRVFAEELITEAINFDAKEIVIETLGDPRSISPSEFRELRRLVADALPDLLIRYQTSV